MTSEPVSMRGEEHGGIRSLHLPITIISHMNHSRSIFPAHKTTDDRHDGLSVRLCTTRQKDVTLTHSLGAVINCLKSSSACFGRYSWRQKM
jgi:hypothetical protein